MATVLVIGSGGREAAICRSLSTSSKVARVFFAPGNATTLDKVETKKLKSVTDNTAVVMLAKEVKADLVVIGPEAPLVCGVSDALASESIPCFGPSKKAAELENSKAWMKNFFARNDLPTARFEIFEDPSKAKEFVKQASFPVVVKTSGLAGGKGVIVPENVNDAIVAIDTIMLDKKFGDAGKTIVVEERLEGEEISVLAFCDGKISVCMPASQDHKRALDGDEGLNTGGMGAFCPTPLYTPKVQRAVKKIVSDTVAALLKEERPFVGVLFAGFMLTRDGPKLLEYNVRMGDPETQGVLKLLKSDLYSIMDKCVKGNLHSSDVKFDSGKRKALTVVLCAKGYPDSYPKGILISNLEAAEKISGVSIDHAGTVFDSEGALRSSGGRVLGVTATAKTLKQAQTVAYKAVAEIEFENDQVHFRTDIARRVLLKKFDSSFVRDAPPPAADDVVAVDGVAEEESERDELPTSAAATHGELMAFAPGGHFGMLAFLSFAIMVQASVYVHKIAKPAKKLAKLWGVSVDVSEVNFAVAFGVLSLLISAIFAAVCSKKPEKKTENVFKIAVAVFTLWWTLSLLVLTFKGPFVGPVFSFFALWYGEFVLIDYVSKTTDFGEKINSKLGSSADYWNAALFAASWVVVFAAVPLFDTEDDEFSAASSVFKVQSFKPLRNYAVIAGVLSAFASGGPLFLELAAKKRVLVFGALSVWWVVATATLTLGRRNNGSEIFPFQVMGNGFLGCYLAVLASFKELKRARNAAASAS